VVSKTGVKTSSWCAWQDHWECWVCRVIQDKLILWGVGSLHHGELLDGTMDFALLPEYFGGSFDRDYAEKLVVEAFEEDTGLKVG
ncbi:hypothetical protein THAOC_37073, partial [Thalassiosira oceanica]